MIALTHLIQKPLDQPQDSSKLCATQKAAEFDFISTASNRNCVLQHKRLQCLILFLQFPTGSARCNTKGYSVGFYFNSSQQTVHGARGFAAQRYAETERWVTLSICEGLLAE